MPVCASAKKLLASMLLLLLFHSSANAAIFSVNYPRVHKIGNAYVLNAQIDYPLTPRVIEALENGVPVTFFQEFELIESIPLLGNFWKWETLLWQTTLNYELSYHALSEKYLLISLDTDDQRSFTSLESALSTLGKIVNLSLPPKYTNTGKQLVLRIRSGLDLHALPTPMRPGALLSSKWQLTSPWVNAVWR